MDGLFLSASAPAMSPMFHTLLVAVFPTVACSDCMFSHEHGLGNGCLGYDLQSVDLRLVDLRLAALG